MLVYQRVYGSVNIDYDRITGWWLVEISCGIYQKIRMNGNLYHNFLVGGWPTPLKKYASSSVGMMTFPTEWKNNIHVPNHQPLTVCVCWSNQRPEFLRHPTMHKPSEHLALPLFNLRLGHPSWRWFEHGTIGSKVKFSLFPLKTKSDGNSDGILGGVVCKSPTSIQRFWLYELLDVSIDCFLMCFAVLIFYRVQPQYPSWII